jgi:N6-L-threonylcarbamoyladenine synthase
MLRKPGLSMSFSGLKTAVLYLLRDHPEARGEDVAASLLSAMTEVLTARVQKAAREVNVETLVLCGGAAANLQIREGFQSMASRNGWKVFWPSIALCTDNAAMIAGLGHSAFLSGTSAPLDLSVKATVSWKAEGRA